MTHPITPREKVERIIKEKVSGPHFTDPSFFVAMEQDRFAAADSILTALASGSGDHAELARLAEAAKRQEINFAFSTQAGADFAKAANPATVLALLAENAALRERESDAVHAERQRGQGVINERDQWIVDLIWQRDANAERATEAERALSEHRIAADLLVSSLKSDKAEAERKLAEAVQVIRDVAETPYTGTDWPRSRAATYLASKEAERG